MNRKSVAIEEEIEDGDDIDDHLRRILPIIPEVACDILYTARCGGADEGGSATNKNVLRELLRKFCSRYGGKMPVRITVDGWREPVEA